jgi:hypothetical protein
MNKTFFLTITNILVFLLYQGFVKSKLGHNIREEVSRWFNQLYCFFNKKNGKQNDNSRR